ncbi:unnamed protein product [Linum trigynum]|uniref:Uncharacterized protein n=1 Tax=Linum trigynum TaxID=586398 RepID=A0AAV2G7F2_9ROSI
MISRGENGNLEGLMVQFLFLWSTSSRLFMPATGCSSPTRSPPQVPSSTGFTQPGLRLQVRLQQIGSVLGSAIS